jgi:hypothetical protein
MQHRHSVRRLRGRSRLLFAAAATVAVTALARSAHALVIDTLFDSTITSQSNASQIEAAINYAAQQYEGLLSTPITVTIQFGYTVTSLGASQGYYITSQPTYSQIKTALQGLTSTSAQISSANNLPSTDPNPSVGWNIDSAEAKALGFTNVANGRSIDGTVQFNQAAAYTFDPFERAVGGSYDFIGTAEHEISEILGRTSSGTNLPYILTHYSSPGTRDFAQTSNDYFSVDGGVTNLKLFSNPTTIGYQNKPIGGDSQDWDNGTHSNFGSQADYIPDAFNSFSDNGIENSLSNVDVTVMNVLGYNPTSSNLSWFGGNGDMLTGFDWNATGQVGINPHHGANMTFSSSGETASHAFTSGENWELSDTSDNGLSLTVSAGTVKITATGSNGAGQGIQVSNNGALTVSGSGTLALAGALSVGDQSTSTNATASFSGSSSIQIGTVNGADQTFYVGYYGEGAVTQSGSSTVTTSQFFVGTNTNSVGFYTLTNSAKFSATGEEFIGSHGVGIFVQSGGQNICSNDFLLGGEADGQGEYVLSSSGTLSVGGAEYIAYDGYATFNQTGGLNTMSTLEVAIENGATGSYTLSGGTLTVNNSAYISGSSTGAGTINVSGAGVFNVFGTLVAVNTPASSINLMGGTINAAALNFDGKPSLLNWTSGTLRLLDGVQLDSSAPSTTTAGAFGPSLDLGAGKTLAVTGNEYLGNSAPFNLTLGGDFSGGSPANNITGNLVIETGSTLTLLPIAAAHPTVTVGGVEWLGYSGPGTIIQEAGTNTVGTAGLVLGANTASLGIYSLSDPTYPLVPDSILSVPASEYVGYEDYASGIFNQSGGTNTFSGGYLYLGYYSAATGTYNLSGGLIMALGSEDIAEYGAGTFNQTGGTNHVDNFFAVGAQTGSNGTYILSGGTLTGGLFEYIGSIGNGTFNQSGGINNSATINIGNSATSTGSYTLAAGAVNAEDENVGVSGIGIFNQSGGQNIVGSDFSSLDIGVNSGATGTYTLSAGTLSVSGFDCYEYVGVSGAGTFNQTGGLNTTGSVLFIAYSTGSTGSYTLSGGTLSTPALYVGGSTSSSGGAGTLTINQSGNLSLPGNLHVWNSGRVNLDVPVTNIGALNISGKGTVNLNGQLNINYANPASDPVASVLSYLKSGFNSGAWTGTSGFISTSITPGSPALSLGYADGNTDPATAAGPNQIVVKYTLLGDTNLDGLVNFQDLVAIVQNFNKANTDWAHGNFLYGASTNFNDLVAVVQNFNKILPPPSGSAESLGGTTLPLVTPTDAQLPEPTLTGLLACGASLLLRRRKR